jgi:hypothetical protein
MKVKFLVTNAMSYDVLVGGVVLYPIGLIDDVNVCASFKLFNSFHNLIPST